MDPGRRTTTLSIHIQNFHFVTSDYDRQKKLITSEVCARALKVCIDVEI